MALDLNLAVIDDAMKDKILEAHDIPFHKKALEDMLAGLRPYAADLYRRCLGLRRNRTRRRFIPPPLS